MFSNGCNEPYTINNTVNLTNFVKNIARAVNNE